MRRTDPSDWMWAQAVDLIDQAERLHRQFFHLHATGRSQAAWEPPVDMFEDEREIVIIAAMPGVTSDRVNVRVSGLPPTTDGQFYEMWLLGADKQLVGLGSFRVGEDGTATLKLPLPVNPDQFSYFDISLEPGDGNPGHSGVSVLRGPTV